MYNCFFFFFFYKMLRYHVKIHDTIASCKKKFNPFYSSLSLSCSALSCISLLPKKFVLSPVGLLGVLINGNGKRRRMMQFWVLKIQIPMELMSWVWVLKMWVSTGSDLGFRIWVWVNHGGFLVWWPWWIKLGFVVLVWD